MFDRPAHRAEGIERRVSILDPSSKAIRPEGARDHHTFNRCYYASDLEPLQGYSRGKYGSQG
jgi:hypothetical protein